MITCGVGLHDGELIWRLYTSRVRRQELIDDHLVVGDGRQRNAAELLRAGLLGLWGAARTIPTANRSSSSVICHFIGCGEYILFILYKWLLLVEPAVELVVRMLPLNLN
jgi:hypothetical protein